MNRWPRLGSLPQDGALWVLTWLGPFLTEPSMPSQRSLLAAITSLNHSVKRAPSKVIRGSGIQPHQLGTQQLVSFTVGDLPALTPGTLYRNGRPLSRSRPTLVETSFLLDFREQIPFRLNDPLGMKLLPRTTLLLTSAWEEMSRTACIVLPFRDNPHGVIVPVMEVLRWCYGSSSGMLQAVLSSELPNVLKEVEATCTRQGDQCDMTLPAGFLAQDAHTLAWLAQDGQARKRALHVDLSVMTNSGAWPRPELSYPSTLFPYSTEEQLHVSGRWIDQPGQLSSFLVYRILQGSFRLPFRVSLPVYRSTTPDLGPGAEPVTRHQQAPPADPARSVLDSRREPRRRGNPARLPALASQFTGEPTTRREEDRAAPTANLKGTPTPQGLFSTGLGSDASSRARRATLVHPGQAGQTGRELPLPIQSGDFETLRRVLKLLAQEHGLQVSELAVNNPGGQEARFEDLLRADDGARVGCLVAQLRRDAQYAYLLEKERTGETYGPLLLAWHIDFREAGELELAALLSARANSRTWPRAHADWLLKPVAHSFRTDAAFAQGLAKHLHSLGATGGP